MRHIIKSIAESKLLEAKDAIYDAMSHIVEEKLLEAKKMVSATRIMSDSDGPVPSYTYTSKFFEQPENDVMVRKAFDGGPDARKEKLKRGNIEEDDMDLFDDGKKQKPKKANLYRHKTSGKEVMHVGQPKDKDFELVKEDEELDEARISIVKARIRGGKVQRRKKVSNVAGYTLRGGQLKRMSPMERRRRKMGQRKGKIKRKRTLNRALMKRKRSLMRRKAIGLD